MKLLVSKHMLVASNLQLRAALLAQPVFRDLVSLMPVFRALENDRISRNSSL
jgi:hypothetical protein